MSVRDPEVLSHEDVIPLEELKRRLADKDLLVVNVLPRAAWEGARIPASLSLPLAEIEKRAEQILPDRNREIVAYCGGPT